METVYYSQPTMVGFLKLVDFARRRLVIPVECPQEPMLCEANRRFLTKLWADLLVPHNDTDEACWSANTIGYGYGYSLPLHGVADERLHDLPRFRAKEAVLSAQHLQDVRINHMEVAVRKHLQDILGSAEGRYRVKQPKLLSVNQLHAELLRRRMDMPHPTFLVSRSDLESLLLELAVVEKTY